MSANPTASKAPTTLISGRVSAVDFFPRKNPTRWNTLVRLAADDEFSTPATVELQSSHDIGKEGEVIRDILCRVGGRYRSYTVTDKQTGEERIVKTADNVLTVL